MKKINFQSIRSRLILSFSAMALLIVAVVLLTLFQIGNMMKLGTDFMENKQPSLLYLESMQNAVNNSNVMSQAFLLTGDIEFNNKKESIWENKIYPAKDSLIALAESWKSASDLILLETINRLATRIEGAQIKVADQANFDVAIPTINLNAFEAIQNDTLFEYAALQSWIDEQLNQNIDGSNNGELFIDNLEGISAEFNLLSDELFEDLQADALLISQEIFSQRDQFMFIESAIVIVAIVLCFLLFRFVLKNVLTSIGKVNQTVRVLGEGNILQTHEHTQDELNLILTEIGYLSDNLKNVQKFALEVGKGNFDNDISVFNNNGDIGTSLAEMRNSLKTVSEEAVVRNWTNKGFAEMGDILRKYSNNLENLSDHVITYLVKYLDANLGSLFIVEENDENKKALRLRATYAYDRKKYIDKTVEPGQGMVGQVYLEKESIYLNDLPENYITITSGLGTASPNSIFIVPLIVNTEVFGIIEIGSFHELKDHEREFIEKISENIASSIQTVKINEQTRLLLDESQQMTEQMRSQEEEMRQNMEELQATQEEMERAQKENNSRIDALERSGMAYIEFLPNGEIIYADNIFLKLFEYQSMGEIEGKHHRLFVDRTYRESDDYMKFWQDLGSGILKEGIFKRYTKNNKEIFIKGAYADVRNPKGEITKIVKFAVDVTAIIKESQLFEAQKEALLADIAALQSQIEMNNANTTGHSEIPGELKHLQQNLDKELKQKLHKNEAQLKKSLAQQKKKLGL